MADDGRSDTHAIDRRRSGSQHQEVIVAEVVQGALVAGRYRLIDRLGRGGAGSVWRAEDEHLERDVAVKVLHPELADDVVAAQRFRREAATAAGLAHPHVVTVFDIGTDGERDHLVMELVEGPSLAELLAEEKPLRPIVVAEIGRAIASALGAAHDQGLIHRDVKPGNVLFTRDGVPKIVDFGIARALDSSATRLTLPGSVMGTARYLSPEQLRDDPVDARADVYSLGLLLYEAVTGVPPWGSGGAAEVAARRLTDDLAPPGELRSGIPTALAETIVRATRRHRDDRHADGRAFASTLAPLADERARAELAALVAPFVATPTPRPRPPRESRTSGQSRQPHGGADVRGARRPHPPAPTPAVGTPPPPGPPPGAPPPPSGTGPHRGSNTAARDDHTRVIGGPRGNEDGTQVIGAPIPAPTIGPASGPVGAAPPDRTGAAPPRARRSRRRRGRIRRLLVRLLVVTAVLTIVGVGLFGMLDLGPPSDLIGDRDAWVDLAREVRDRLVDLRDQFR